MEPDGGNAAGAGAGAAEMRGGDSNSNAAGVGDDMDVDGAVASGASPPTNEELTVHDDDLQNSIDSARGAVAEANAAMATMEENDKKIATGMKIAAVFARYRKLRHRVNEENGTDREDFWQHNCRHDPWKSSSAGRGTLLLRDLLHEEIGCDVGLREQLILEAARKSYFYLVRELLCPTPYDEDMDIEGEGHAVAKSPLAVSMNVTDDKRNTILHLAVQGGKAPLVRWLLRHSETYFKSKEMDNWKWNSLLNDNLQTPLSWAIKRGSMKLLNIFLREEQFSVFPSATSYAFDLPHRLGMTEKLDVTDDTSAFVQGEIDLPLLVQKVSTKLRQLVFDNKRRKDNLFQCLAFFDARHHASQAARDAVDKWMRYFHLQNLERDAYMKSDGTDYSLPWIKEVLGGRSCPW